MACLYKHPARLLRKIARLVKPAVPRIRNQARLIRSEHIPEDSEDGRRIPAYVDWSCSHGLHEGCPSHCCADARRIRAHFGDRIRCVQKERNLMGARSRAQTTRYLHLSE